MTLLSTGEGLEDCPCAVRSTNFIPSITYAFIIVHLFPEKLHPIPPLPSN